MTLIDVLKLLAENKIETSIKYDFEREAIYLDLETRAKSFLHLYEDGTLRGRYNYETIVDLNQNAEYIVNTLCFEFNNALHGRGYCQEGWKSLCMKNDVQLEVYSDF